MTFLGVGEVDPSIPGGTRWRRNDFITSDKLNAIAEAQSRVVQGVGLPGQGPGAAVVVGGTSSSVAQFRYKTTGSDFFNAAEWDGVIEGDTIKIAKPYLLRKTPFDTKTRDGITYTYTDDVTRTATDVSLNTETQTVVPSYVVDDIIYATQGVVGGTATTITSGLGEVNDVVWLDMNLDGRAWARVSA